MRKGRDHPCFSYFPRDRTSGDRHYLFLVTGGDMSNTITKRVATHRAITWPLWCVLPLRLKQKFPFVADVAGVASRLISRRDRTHPLTDLQTFQKKDESDV